MTRSDYPRDLIGYGGSPPHPRWPNDAKIAVSVVLNYEEGAENCVLHGDAASESMRFGAGQNPAYRPACGLILVAAPSPRGNLVVNPTT